MDIVLSILAFIFGGLMFFVGFIVALKALQGSNFWTFVLALSIGIASFYGILNVFIQWCR